MDMLRVFSNVAHDDLVYLYSTADALVQPSRGEGWGRPHQEAMTIGLPVIATNWSGNTAFMSDANSFLVPTAGLEEITEGAFRGHQWARLDVAALRRVMRHVSSDASALERRQRTDLARQQMHALYDLEPFAHIVVAQLRDAVARRDARLASSS